MARRSEEQMMARLCVDGLRCQRSAKQQSEKAANEMDAHDAEAFGTDLLF